MKNDNGWLLWKQCDQMAKLIIQYLAIYNNENLTKSIQIVPKWVHNFAKYEIFAEDFSIFASGEISPNLVTLCGSPQTNPC